MSHQIFKNPLPFVRSLICDPPFWAKPSLRTHLFSVKTIAYSLLYFRPKGALKGIFFDLLFALCPL